VFLVILLYIYEYIIFWRLFAIVSLYMVDMTAYYTITLFEYLSLYITTECNTVRMALQLRYHMAAKGEISNLAGNRSLILQSDIGHFNDRTS
jgi:hypothetical protein